LIRFNKASSPTVADDNAGVTDAAWTQENAQQIGSLVVTATANKLFTGRFDTVRSGEDLGVAWTIGIMNRSGQALNASGHIFEFTTEIDEIQ
jgi:hypothetical protein